MAAKTLGAGRSAGGGGRARRVPLAPAVAMFFLVGCSDQVPARPSTAERWTLEPSGVIGELDPADPIYAFEVISDARLLPGGGVAVADGRKLVKIFDQSGSFTAAFGRVGDGPTELRFLDRLFRASDSSLVILDSGRNRALTFSNSGAFSSARQLGSLRLDRVVVAEGGGLFGLSRWEYPRDTESVVTGRYPSDLVMVAESGRMEVLLESSGPLVSARSGRYFRTPLGAAAAIAPWGEGVAHTPGDQPVVHFFDMRGRKVDSVVTDRAHRAVTEAVAGRWIDEQTRQLKERGVDDPRSVLPFGEEPQWPSELPVYTRLVGADECVWAEVFSLPGDPREFDVLRPGVGHIATVVADAGLFLLDVVGSRAAFLARDEFGVQSLALWTVSGGLGAAGPCG